MIKYEVNLLQKVKNAIGITNKLLNIDFRKMDGVHFSEKADKSDDLREKVKQLKDLGFTNDEIKEGLKEVGRTDAEIERVMGSNN